jgi:hypothetical protein
MLRVIAAGNALIVLEFFLDHLKLFLTHNGRDLSHHNPVFWRHALDTAIASPDRFERGNASGRRSIVIASCCELPNISATVAASAGERRTPAGSRGWAGSVR